MQYSILKERKMKKGEIKRQEVIEKIAAHILSNGLKEISLRQLANAANASDRMLIHYFKDKETILKLVLTRITENFITLLEQTKTKPMPYPELIQFLMEAMHQETMKPYIRLSMELIAMAFLQEEPFLGIIQEISDAFYSWIHSAIKVEIESERDSKSAHVLITIEGMLLLDGIKRANRIEKAMSSIEQISSRRP